jgi:glutamate dehydrogenase/leucine dehydrogenase
MSEATFRFCDDLGPHQILSLYEPALGMKAIVVVDNVAAGPAIGGTRMAPDVSLEECFRLARAMTFKNAAAGLPHGGAKSVLFGDPLMPRDRKEQWLRAFARGIEGLTGYIPGPDMGTDEVAMAWIGDETGRSVGLPQEVGGIPLDEIGATARGLLACADVARRRLDMALEGMRVAVQGFGAVGKNAARCFVEAGAVLVAAADSSGAVHDPSGLDARTLAAFKEAGGRIAEFDGGEHIGREAIIAVDCDVLIPAARPDVVREDNEAEVRARMIVPGANIGVTAAAEARLARRGVLCLPDYIANAGGVICAAVEYAGGTRLQALSTIDEKVRANTEEVLTRAFHDGVLPREAADAMARSRVEAATRLRRFR